MVSNSCRFRLEMTGSGNLKSENGLRPDVGILWTWSSEEPGCLGVLWRMCDGFLTATVEVMLRLEKGMFFVLLGLRRFLDAVVLRLEIRNCNSGRIGQARGSFGDGRRSFVHCIVPPALCGR
jgi:hypothetical protein